MRQVALRAMNARGSVDVCDQCGGVFLEFFDGEPGALAREVTQHLRRRVSPLRVGGDPYACPDCRRHMDVHPYLDVGPNLARCSGCMSMFATPEQVDALSSFHLIQDDAPSWLARLTSFVFGGRRG